MLGQNVLVIPKESIVAVINSENNELFQDSPALAIMKKYLSDEGAPQYTAKSLKKMERDFFMSRRAVVPHEPRRGIGCLLGFKKPKPFDESWAQVLGTYTLEKNNQGIMPLFIRLLQNNYGGGIRSISLERGEDTILLTVREESGVYTVKVGLYGYENTVIDYNGEKYLISAACERGIGEMSEDVFKIELIFPEMPNSRLITLRRDVDGTLIIKMTENPNQKLAEPLVEAIYMTNPKLSFAVGLLEARLGDRFLQRKLEKLFAPTLRAISTKEDQRALAIMNAEAEQSAQETKMLTDILLKMADDGT